MKSKVDDEMSDQLGRASTGKKEGKKKKKHKDLKEEENLEKVCVDDTVKKKKKRKVSEAAEQASDEKQDSGQQVEQQRKFTVSVAIPGSIVNNKQSDQLTAALAGYLARSLAIYRVDEVVVYSDNTKESKEGADYLARMLQYLETPQYLRRSLIPMHPHLRLAGLLPPLDAPHHPRQHEWTQWREGAVLSESGNAKVSHMVNVGLTSSVRVGRELPVGTRVTVKMGDDPDRSITSSDEVYELVSPSQPRDEGGLYWGYSVRQAKGLSGVFAECPFEDGYDFSIGTSERGETPASGAHLHLPNFLHLLVAFGGLHGIEESVSQDSELEVKDPQCLFDLYLNTCPTQGSRTIRCEEAVLISLAFLQPAIR